MTRARCTASRALVLLGVVMLESGVLRVTARERRQAGGDCGDRCTAAQWCNEDSVCTEMVAEGDSCDPNLRSNLCDTGLDCVPTTDLTGSVCTATYNEPPSASDKGDCVLPDGHVVRNHEPVPKGHGTSGPCMDCICNDGSLDCTTPSCPVLPSQCQYGPAQRHKNSCCLACPAGLYHNECHCTGLNEPVCASNNKTYRNQCEAECLNLTVLSSGKCAGDCPCPTEHLTPMCGSDGKVYPSLCHAEQCSLVSSAFLFQCTTPSTSTSAPVAAAGSLHGSGPASGSNTRFGMLFGVTAGIVVACAAVFAALRYRRKSSAPRPWRGSEPLSFALFNNDEFNHNDEDYVVYDGTDPVV